MKELRTERGLTGTQLAEYLSIVPSHYYGLESGAKTLSEEYLVKLSDFYGVTIDYILGRDETPPPGFEEQIPKDVKVIMKDAKELTPEQRKLIANIIKEFLENKPK